MRRRALQLLALAIWLNDRRAAERLHLAQPPLPASIQQPGPIGQPVRQLRPPRRGWSAL